MSLFLEYLSNNEGRLIETVDNEFLDPPCLPGRSESCTSWLSRYLCSSLFSMMRLISGILRYCSICSQHWSNSGELASTCAFSWGLNRFAICLSPKVTSSCSPITFGPLSELLPAGFLRLLLF